MEFSGVDQFPFPCKENNYTTSKPYKCSNCNGKGKIAKTYANGMTYVNNCKACNGEGGFMSSPEQREEARQQAFKEEEAKKTKLSNALKNQLGEEAFVHLLIKSSDNDFLNSLYKQGSKKGYLSEKQIACIKKDMQRDKEYSVKKDKNKKPKANLDLTSIVKHLSNATENELKKPRLHCVDDKDNTFAFSLAPQNGKNAGFVYVKYNSEYLGKIDSNGDFYGWETPQNVIDSLMYVSKNSDEATIKYGRKFGKCGLCSRKLTKTRSIQAGVGPICASKYGIEY